MQQCKDYVAPDLSKYLIALDRAVYAADRGGNYGYFRLKLYWAWSTAAYGGMGLNDVLNDYLFPPAATAAASTTTEIPPPAFGTA